MSDEEPTINGVGGEGFAVDGTDSFAIEPVVPTDEGPGPPPGTRRGLFLTVAAGLVLVLIVVIAGSAGGDDQGSLRGDDVRTSEVSTTTTESTEPETSDTERESTSSAGSGRSGDEAREPTESDSEYDDLTTDETFDATFDDEYDDDFSLDDFDLEDYEDDFDDFDDDFTSSGGGRYLPRRVPYVPSSRRPTATVPPWYLPTTTTTTTLPEETTTSSSSSTTTTLAPDTTPPGAPVITAPVSITNDSTPAFAGTGEDGSTVTVSEGGSALCTIAVVAGSWSCSAPTALVDGMHSFTATAVDAAGNSATGSTVSVTIDTQAPVPPVIVWPPNDNVVSTAPKFTGTGERGSTVTLSEGTAVRCTATVAADGSWSCTPTLDEGERTLTPAAVDAAGNPSTAGVPVRVTVDAASPVILAPADGSGTTDTTPTFSGTGEDGSTVSVSVDGTERCMADVSGGTWSCNASELVAGTYLITTAAGTIPGTSIRLTVNAAAPTVTSPVNASTVPGPTVTFVGTGRPGDTITVSEGATATCTDVVASGAWSCSSATLAAGQHTFTTSARDTAGGSTPGATVTVTVAP